MLMFAAAGMILLGATGGLVFPDAPPLYYDLSATPAEAARANIFPPDERVRIRVPQEAADRAVRFEVRDDGAAVVAEGGTENDAVALNGLGPGWYRIDFYDTAGAALGWTTTVVLGTRVKPDKESPVALDVALSWVAPDTDTDRERMAEIAALAGVGWVRDRLRWREIEPEPGQSAPIGKYDRAAKLQHRRGGKILQVFHDMPKSLWTPSEEGSERTVPDLRAVHAFCRTAAKRFHGTVGAWEPWNEANAGSFGGWPVSQMCAWQKAAWLGFKEGDKKITVCWQPIAGINTESLARGILLNETWPYYDVFSIHSYDWNHAYADLWRHARDAASGRPVWVTESDRGIHAPENAPGGEPAPSMALLKAQFIGQSCADSMAAGAERHFHFILGQYMEGTVQFGLLRKDMTPRPGYAALAAAARALRGTKCIGSWSPNGENPGVPGMRFVAFRGKDRDVLVKWAETGGDWDSRGACRMPQPVLEDFPQGGCMDYLGREISEPTELTGAPVYVTLPKGACDRLPLAPVPRGEIREGTACPVVIQTDLPRVEVRKFKPEWTEEHDFVVPENSETPLTAWVYNFSGKTVSGTICKYSAPGNDHWEVSVPTDTLTILPGERVRLDMTLKVGGHIPTKPEVEFWVTLMGDFGEASRPVSAFRVRLLKPDGGVQ